MIELVSNSLLRCAMLFCFVLFLSLTGCATAPVLMELKPDWVSLQQVNYWTVKGRVAFRNGNEGWHGRISWVSSPLEDKIKIAGPIGQGAIVILMRGDVVEVLFSDGRKEVTRDPAALLERQLGFSVPLKALRWWIRGLPEENILTPCLFWPGEWKEGLTARPWQNLPWVSGIGWQRKNRLPLRWALSKQCQNLSATWPPFTKRVLPG